MKNRKWSILYGILLLSFTIYMVLDTFVIANTYQTNATAMNLDLFMETSEAADIESDSETEETSEKKAITVEEEETQLTDSQAADDSEHSSSHSRKSTGSGRKKSSDESSHSKGQERGNSAAGSSDDDSTEGDTDLTTQVTASTTDYSYSDENISITITQYTVNDTAVYVADIQLTSVQYLKTAFAEDAYGKNITETTSEIASAHDAILAINGDYYGVQETGYVIRNGILYRSESNGEDILCIFADGTMEVLDSDDYTAEELVSMGVWQTLCFGPGLITDGEVTVSVDEEVDKAKTSNPRTAIGMIENGHYVFVVSDGRTEESEGLTLYELAEFMESLGCTTAYNLDGGGSSTMVFQGQVVNNPTSSGTIKERSVSDIVYIG